MDCTYLVSKYRLYLYPAYNRLETNLKCVPQPHANRVYIIREEFEDTKGVIRIRKSKKIRQ